MRMLPATLALLSIALLCGCGAAPPSANAPQPEPDCSFRSASTCWTVAGRFPPRRAKSPTPTPKPGDIRALSPTVVASGGDSARGSR